MAFARLRSRALMAAALVIATAVTPAWAADIARPHLALVITTFHNAYFESMVDGAEDGAADLGASIEVTAPDLATSIDQQITIIDRLISQKVDGIVLVPADSVRVIPVLKRAEAAGIPVINVDNPIDARAAAAAGLDLPPLVTVDNADAAHRAVAMALASFPRQQTVLKAAIIEGIRGTANSEARKAGALRAFGEDRRVTLVATETGNWERDEGTQVAAAIIAAAPDLDLLFCANDNMALGAVDALTTAHAHAKIVGYDALPEAIDAVREGELAATVDQRTARQGRMAVEYLMKRLQGESVPQETFVDVRIVSK